jgi:hypothetical protein
MLMPPQRPDDPRRRIAEFWQYAPDRTHERRQVGTEMGRPMMRPPQISANLSVDAAFSRSTRHTTVPGAIERVGQRPRKDRQAADQ